MRVSPVAGAWLADDAGVRLTLFRHVTRRCGRIRLVLIVIAQYLTKPGAAEEIARVLRRHGHCADRAFGPNRSGRANGPAGNVPAPLRRLVVEATYEL
jgi:hypothetical protein